MSEFLGARISLISKSDIRYVGTLQEINSEESTVSLENVRAFGTEGRRGGGDDEAAPSDQIYDYIIFRGKDVKDLRVEEGPSTVKENKPPAAPEDPAIVGARARPNNLPPPNQYGGPGPGGPGFGYYPPPMGWGRGNGPPPPQGFGMQYPPPPAGWYPPGQGFPPGPPAPGAGPWGNHPFPPGPPNVPGPNGRQVPNQDRPAPIGAASDKKPSTPAQQGDSNPVMDRDNMGDRTLRTAQRVPVPGSFNRVQPANTATTQHEATRPTQQGSERRLPTSENMNSGTRSTLTGSMNSQQAPATRGPPPPVESKPTVEEVKATAASLVANASSASTGEPTKSIPTGPKSSVRPTQIMPAVPLPAALTAKVSQQTQATHVNSSQDSRAMLHDATQAAKAAVAVAMARLDNPGSSIPANNGPVDNLARRVNEMRVGAPRGDAPRGGQHTRGGRGRGPRPTKVEVPDADFDFASSNAKFNKEDVVKEAIASGSPLGETVPDGEEPAPEDVLETTPGSGAPPAYNKTRSFFDNISSEAKDRADNAGQKPGGREWRGEEQRKNMETFGQGSVDGGYRGGYRGRGRGRGNRGRGFVQRGGVARGGAPFRNARETQSAS